MTHLILLFLFMIHISTLTTGEKYFTFLHFPLKSSPYQRTFFGANYLQHKSFPSHEKHFHCCLARRNFFTVSVAKSKLFYCDMSLISVIQFIIHKKGFPLLFYFPYEHMSYEPLPTVMGFESLLLLIEISFLGILRFSRQSTQQKYGKYRNVFVEDIHWQTIRRQLREEEEVLPNGEKNQNKPCAVDPSIASLQT